MVEIAASPRFTTPKTTRRPRLAPISSHAAPPTPTRIMIWLKVGDEVMARLLEWIERYVILSSGKSLVLDSIVRRDFLPRGSGIVTTRQLLRQLHRTENGPQDYRRFLHMPKRRFTDFWSSKEMAWLMRCLTGLKNLLKNRLCASFKLNGVDSCTPNTESSF